MPANAGGRRWAGGGVSGLNISVANTVVLTRVLVDNNDPHTVLVAVEM